MHEKQNLTSSIDTAYKLSLDAVNLSIQRFGNQDTNLDKIITWTTSFSTALLTFVSSGKIIPAPAYTSVFFIVGAALGLSSLTIAFIGKFYGHVSTANPAKLFEDHLDSDDQEFKRNHIFYFGEDCNEMDSFTYKKWLLGVIAILLFSAELICFIIWLSSNTTS